MSHHQKPYSIAENIGYTLESGRTLFQGIHTRLAADDRVALVGVNGVGKSTLLKILVGQIPPTRGAVTCNGSMYYLPQIGTIRASLRSESVFDFLNAASNEWWEIEQMLETRFGTTLDLSLPIQSLSGGELTQLFLAVGLSRSPDLLLLDEPTNHLDYLALENLARVLCQFPGGLAIVSHNPFFLDRVTQSVWELTASGLQVYGGNFSDYREQKQLETAAKVRAHETARKELKQTKATALSEQKRAARSHRRGQQSRGGMPRIVAGNLQRKAEVVAGKLKVKHEKAIAAAAEKVAQTKIATHKASSIQLGQNSHKHRNLIEIDRANLWVEERLLLKEIELRVSSGDRLAISGLNGSGKSCLVKAILGLDSTPAYFQGGEVRIANMQTVYLDQNYELVDRTQTVLQNLQRIDPTLNYQLLRQQLGHFLFFNDDAHKVASVLSGGELARLAMAMITTAKIDLLILDEPVNNLDVTTIDRMVEALNEYRSALWVVSHDLDFLSRINITRSFAIEHQTLQPTVCLPEDRSRDRRHLLT
ncbi:MAG: ATP-binding cassette domain-containing protein [Cyanobacteriota bacterium]|nr:ATP-binding cassette domain-containing protein [Cyanobacteriota bacterium]